MSANRACVAAPHLTAAEVGAAVLRGGGSAVDAAIAMNAVLCVVYPHMAGLGGDGFWIVWDPSERRASGVNASGPAAALATREWYGSRGLARIPERGPGATLTVPGAVDGWRLAHERWGRLEWRELFGAAVRLAREGAPVAPSLARYHRRDHEELLAHAAAAQWLAGAGGPSSLLVQPELARSLDAIARLGARAAFYEGDIAEEIGRSLAAADSPLRADDLARFRATWVEPLRGSYRGLELLELPPNTQGISAIQILRLLEGYDVGGWGDGSADYVHACVEATKLAFADRDAWVTDPDFVQIPIDRLASPEYAEARRALIRRERSLPPDRVAPGISFDPGARRARPEPTRTRDGDTCYFCAVDADGLAVSCIQSIYFAFGSMVVAGDTGILMNDRGTAFSLDDRTANRLEPRKRPLQTLIPAMLLDDRGPRLVFGSMGGEGQPQTQAALVTRTVDFGYDPEHAVAAPRWLFGRTWGEPSQALSLESRFPAELAPELRRRGHDVRVLGPWEETMGHAQLILRQPDGTLAGAADPRGDGGAIGV